VIEYLIRRTDGEWFDYPLPLPEFCHPTTVEWKVVEGWGNARFAVAGVEVSVSDEDPGLQVSFEGDIDPNLAGKVVNEMLDNVEQATGQKGRIVQISW